MQMEKFVNIIKSGSLNIPFVLLTNYKQLAIDLDEVILLSYLMDKNIASFDYKEISKILGFDEKTVMILFNQLAEKDLIGIKVTKNNKGIMDEVISLDNLYNKLAFIIIGVNDSVKDDTVNNNIYENFEKEFGRTLSPMEYEFINAWLDQGHSNELIAHALKEAVFNGVNNFRYIDKILFEWQKKGYKRPEDVVSIKKPKTNAPIADVPNYNWLDDHE